MDFNVLIFLTALSIVLFYLAMMIGGWVRLGLGWLAGGLIIIVGLTIGDGSGVTINTLLSTDTISQTALELGISDENFMIIYALAGFVMIAVATLVDK